MKVIITFTFCCNNLWKSKFMALEKSGKLGEFFSPTLWPPCYVMLSSSEHSHSCTPSSRLASTTVTLCLP